jgi:drug/metabolite transporter (DMT)-like permease
MLEMIRTPLIAFWALVMVTFIWGVGFVIVDDAINTMPVNVFNAFRFGIAALTLLPLWLFTRKQPNSISRFKLSALFKIGAGLGLLLFLGFSFQTQGMLYTSVSNTGFITGLSVPLVPIAGLFIFRKKVGSEVWWSAILATIGLYLLTIGDKLELNSGDIMVAFAALCYALHITFMARLSHNLPIIPLSIIQLGAVAVYSTIVSVYDWKTGLHADYPPVFNQLSDSGVIAAILYSALFASAFAYWVQMSSQRLIEPHKIALIFALEPIFAHLAAYIFLDEHLGVKGAIGAGLILFAMLYSELGGKRKLKAVTENKVNCAVE